jgi:hypothetical protein
MTGGQVNYARLIATNNASGFDTGHRHGETQALGELTTVGDWKNHRQLGYFIELVWRYN